MKKYISIKNIFLLCILGVSFGACTDTWDEHYSVDPGVASNSSETLWERINSDSELTDFAKCLKRVGYDKVLDQNRFYTVWAPVNGFTYDENMSDSLLEIELLKNHIADYGHNASATMEKEPIQMLNGKFIEFAENGGQYTFSNNLVAKENIPAKNGILHKVSGSAAFNANVWEELSKKPELTSICDYLYSFNKVIFDEYNSVQGPVVDGKITYLDSVTYINNIWFYQIGYLNREDSTYIMVAPTNEAWDKSFAMVKNFVVNPDNTDILSNPDSLQDEMAKQLMCRYLTFSKTIQRGDSLISNFNHKLVFHKDEVDLMLNTYLREKKELSNGTMYVVDSLHLDPLKCWQDTIKVEGEDPVLVEYEKANYHPISIHKDSVEYKFISDGRYAKYEPQTSTGNPILTITIPRTYSSRYRVKCVFVPENYNNPKDDDVLKPIKLKASLAYRGSDGEVKTVQLKNAEGGEITNDPNVVDTLTFEIDGKDYMDFPVSEANIDLYEGENRKYFTKLKLESNVKFSERAKFSRMLCLDCVILEPLRK